MSPNTQIPFRRVFELKSEANNGRREEALEAEQSRGTIKMTTCSFVHIPLSGAFAADFQLLSLIHFHLNTSSSHLIIGISQANCEHGLANKKRIACSKEQEG